ncbi:hypothetical protein PENANT_c021G05230 [Penicillium antarcticum]|uniref:Uncharacterized protein n=1 Tax=Penicillium antarcticum TaxID=416450 RepID=A0A1V6PZS8_9EURO|nr:hypothetical protein PENANT_c021G05230 [Penicillium antarcticum]
MSLKHPKQNSKNADSHQNAENHEETDQLHVKQSCPQQGLDESSGDPYAALSEIAAPKPVERLPEGELARHPSLEQRLSHPTHSSGNNQDGYEALSEIAAPEPVETHTDGDAAQHPSLERQL